MTTKSVIAGRVHRAAGARAHDGGDLRNHARGERVAQEDVGVAAERRHAFLDPRAPRVVEADDRRAELHRQVHDLHDLGGVGLRQRAAEDGEVLREGEHLAAVDQAVAADDAVAGHDLVGHAEVETAVGDELVELFERARIEQQIDPLASGQLAGLVLAAQPLRAAALLGAAFEFGERRGQSVSVVGHRRPRSPPSTACDFSQSFRNFSRPLVVRGWL